MNLIIKYFRKIVIGITGTGLIILGIILIPLPGPGLLVILAGLIVLSLEFEWAKPHVKRIKHHAKKVTQLAKPTKK